MLPRSSAAPAAAYHVWCWDFVLAARTLELPVADLLSGRDTANTQQPLTPTRRRLERKKSLSCSDLAAQIAVAELTLLLRPWLRNVTAVHVGRCVVASAADARSIGVSRASCRSSRPSIRRRSLPASISAPSVRGLSRDPADARRLKPDRRRPNHRHRCDAVHAAVLVRRRTRLLNRRLHLGQPAAQASQ